MPPKNFPKSPKINQKSSTNRVLGASGSVLGVFWGVLGASWSVLGSSWNVLEASWSVLRASWSVLEPLGPENSVQEAIFTRCGGGVAASRSSAWPPRTPNFQREERLTTERLPTERLQKTFVETVCAWTQTRSWAPSGPMRIQQRSKAATPPPRQQQSNKVIWNQSVSLSVCQSVSPSVH